MTAMRALVVAAMVACRGDASPPPPTPVAPLPDPPLVPSVNAFARADAAVPIDAPIDAAAAPGAQPEARRTPPPGGKGDFVASLGSDSYPMGFGIASPQFTGVMIRLFWGSASCEHEPSTTEPETAEVRFTIPAGPNAAFYAGHPVSPSTVSFESVEKLQLIGLDGAITQVTLQPFAKHAHARVRGELQGSAATMLGTLAMHGHFDVELCEEPDYVQSVHGAPPAGPARGRHGSEALAPESVIAKVGGGDRDPLYIQKLAFYSVPDAPCPGSGSQPSTTDLVVYADPVGGTLATHPLVGTLQPTDVVMHDIGGVFPGWIRIDGPLALGSGARLRGTIWAENGSDGSFGGSFDAKVCPP